METKEKNYGTQLDSTAKTIEDHVEKKSSTGVAGTINKWIDTLEDHEGFKKIAANLRKLNKAIESKETDNIVTLLATLGEETIDAAEKAEGAEATKIKHLGKALTTASKAIAKLAH